jgi:hypothetical protein
MEGKLESKRARGLLRIESRERDVKARRIVKSSPVFAAMPMKAANMRIGLIMGTQFTATVVVSRGAVFMRRWKISLTKEGGVAE